MAHPSLLPSLLTLFLLLIFSTQPHSATSDSFSPSSPFISAVRSTIDEVQKVLSILSTVAGTGPFGDSRISSAVNDCVDLLDLSSDELSWTISSTPASTTTGDHHSDLKSWLSAALGNQDTCLDGFDGTDGLVKSLVAQGLQTVTSLVGQALQMSGQFASSGRKLLSTTVGGFPEWVSAGDRRLMQAPASVVQADAVVAADGSGTYKTVTEAVEAAPVESTKRYVIYVKRGVYNENVDIKKKKWNLMLIGDGMDATIITGDRSFVDGWTTFRSATFAVSGRGFLARDLTIENSAGPQKHQAVALRSDSDLSAFYRCSIRGYQDTLYAHSLRQFYRECRISGTVDFIFGNAAAVFQNCLILPRKPLPDQKNSITAQGRKDPNQNTGFTIQFCNVTADADLSASMNSTWTYLGRPWKEYSRTVFMQSYLGPVIRPEGWLAWQGDFALSTLYYGEYSNSGPGAGVGARVKWPGFHVITDPKEASNFTVGQFIDGNLWLPSTGVAYTAGLSL